MDKEAAAIILKNASLLFSALGYISSSWIWIYLCFHLQEELPGFAIMFFMFAGSLIGVFGLILAGCSHLLNRNQRGLGWPYLLNIILIILPVFASFTEMTFRK